MYSDRVVYHNYYISFNLITVIFQKLNRTKTCTVKLKNCKEHEDWSFCFYIFSFLEVKASIHFFFSSLNLRRWVRLPCRFLSWHVVCLKLLLFAGGPKVDHRKLPLVFSSTARSYFVDVMSSKLTFQLFILLFVFS